MIQIKKRKIDIKKSGSVVVEFMLVFPAFLFLSLLVIELSLMWVDKHFLRLAAFDAARNFTLNDLENPCQNPDNSMSAELKNRLADAKNRAKRAAALKMAAVAPTFSYMTGLAGLNLNLDSQQSYGVFTDTIIHLISRLPSAYGMTHVECSQVEPNIFNTKVTYYRIPRMPFVKNAIWAIYILGQIEKAFEDAGLKGIMRFRLDDAYFGIRVDSPALADLSQKKQAIKNEIKSALGVISEMKMDFHEASNVLPSAPSRLES